MSAQKINGLQLLETLKECANHLEAMMTHLENKPAKFREYCWEKAVRVRAVIAQNEVTK